MRLSLEVDKRNAAIILAVDNAAGVTGFIRSDRNGTRRVRLRADELPATGPLRFTDWEPALSGLIQYQAIGQDASAWAEVGAMLPRFHIPSIPQYSQVVQTVTAYGHTRDTRSVFHEVINRSDDVVAEGEMTPRRGRLAAVCETYQDALDLESVLRRGKVIQYRESDHHGIDMYFHTVSLAVDQEADRWVVTLEYREVDFPTGPVLSTKNWTFAALAAEVPSFEDVTARYGTFIDLAIGEER